MKQMRSRFRLITLLLVCCFMLTLVLCGGSALKAAGVTLSSLPVIGGTPAPESSALPEMTLGASPAPEPEDGLPAGTPVPGADNSPDPEYNVFGL